MIWLNITINRYCILCLLFVSLLWKRGKTFRRTPFRGTPFYLSLYFLSMKKFVLSIVAAIALPMGLQAQRAVRWTLGVTTPIVSNTPTAFKYVGFSVKASYEKIRNVELGLSVSSEGFLRKVNTSGSALAQSVPYSPQFGISKAYFCLKIVSTKAQKEDYFSYICCWKPNR